MAKPAVMTHQIKLVNPYYEQVKNGEKDFVITFQDQDFNVDDTVILNQFTYAKPTGLELTRKIKYILRRFKGLQRGYVVLGLER